MSLKEVLNMAVIGSRLQAILIDPYSGMQHDISGYVDKVDLFHDFDGVIRAEFSIVDHVNSNSTVSTNRGKLLMLQDAIESIEDTIGGKSSSWVCAFCHAENTGRGDDGCCSRCGAPKGRSNAEKRI